MKFGWGTLGQNVREDARWVNELRRGVGPKVDLMVDMGAAISFGDALWLGNALAEDDVYFLEEPLSPDNLDGFAELVAASPTAIATGEKETTRFGFRDLMERGKLRIIPAGYRPCRRHHGDPADRRSSRDTKRVA